VSEAGAPGGESLDWRAIYERYAGEIARYLMKLTAEPDGAKDLMQETFMRAIERQDQLRDRAAVRPWLYRIATNLAVSSMRRRQLRARLSFVRAEHPDPALSVPEVDQVRAALRSIAPKQAACLILRERGFSRREIATICGLTEDGAKSRLARGETSFISAYRRLERGSSR
jgi:RNA polymerase sigma-70 factor (ECF subfamily)